MRWLMHLHSFFSFSFYHNCSTLSTPKNTKIPESIQTSCFSFTHCEKDNIFYYIHTRGDFCLRVFTGVYGAFTVKKYRNCVMLRCLRWFCVFILFFTIFTPLRGGNLLFFAEKKKKFFSEKYRKHRKQV